MSDPNGDLERARTAARTDYEMLRGWFVDEALPLWARVGVDPAGGFFEKLDRSGAPIEEARRTRVVGRQIFVFATAARLGWRGPSADLVAHGLTWFRRACLAPEGTVHSTARPDGTPEKTTFDLYDHAFALFGLSAAFVATGDPELAATAERMREAMRAGWGHPDVGFEAARPRRLPLEANPHMHVFEAAEAWAAALPAEAAAPWIALGDEIAGLALDRFIDPVSGALREFYDGDWRPMPGDAGRLVEPGHQFEWAWLLIRWGRSRGNARAIAAARRLVALAESHGVDAERGVAIGELWDDLSVKSAATRVWPQTERIKAWLAMATLAEDDDARAEAFSMVATAARGLRLFLDPSAPGLWHERMAADGTFLDEPAPASSLYHIACALAEMQAAPLALPA